MTQKKSLTGLAVGFAAFASVASANMGTDTISITNAKESKWTNCIAGAAVGGALGGLIGNRIGKKGEKRNRFGLNLGKKESTAIGAVIGAGAGCAIARSLSQQEQEKVGAVENEAIKNGTAERSWKTSTGATRTATAEARPIKVAERPELSCQQTTTTLTEGGETAGVYSQVKCQDESGEFQPAGVLL